jgi:hypothetical protein
MEGRDFAHNFYVLERDPITGKEHHERGDHNHILKRIAGATRECRYPLLDPEAFDKAMQDPDTGLSHTALTGQRPQSVEDAERLLSYHVASSMQKNDFIFDIWLLHGDLYRVSPFQVYRTSTSCLQYDLELFMFAVMKTFVTVISASTGRNDFIFDIWLWHGELYRISPFQVYRTSTSCLPHS